MSAVLEHREAALELPGKIEAFGIDLPEGMSFEEWSRTAKDAQRFWQKMPWVVGDILAFGAERWPDVWEQALAFTDRSNETLRKYLAVCQKFPRDRRTWDLSFTYYQRVAFLPEEQQVELLDRAVAGEINTTDLSQLARKPRAASPVANEIGADEAPQEKGADTASAPVDPLPEFDNASERLQFVLGCLKGLRNDPAFRDSIDPSLFSASDCELEGHWLVNLAGEIRHRQSLEFDSPRSRAKAGSDD